MRIHDVLRAKAGQDVVMIAPDAPVRELVALLSDHNIGALIVSTDGETVDGIVSERDVVRRLRSDETVLDGPVAAIMTTDVHSCDPEGSLDDLMTLMTDKRIRHVPVVVDGRLSGIISIGDVVKNRIGELEFERDQLGSYINS